MKKFFNFSFYRKENYLIIHWNWNISFIPFEGIEYSKTPNFHQLVFCGTDNLYWVFSKTWQGKYKFFYKSTNDHTSCGG